MSDEIKLSSTEKAALCELYDKQKADAPGQSRGHWLLKRGWDAGIVHNRNPRLMTRLKDRSGPYRDLRDHFRLTEEGIAFVEAMNACTKGK